MSRLDEIFAGLRGRGGKALIPFITAGDPDLAATGELLEAIEAAGARVCEVGFPFSDPLADGPVIQESMGRALARGLRVEQVFELVGRLRARLRMGMVAMTSYSIVTRHGPGGFVRRAAEAGFDGLIFPDLPVEESGEAQRWAAETGLSLILLIAPTTPMERAERIVRASSGFVYVLARSGLTGERAALPTGLAERIERLRGLTELPIAVGFGISTAQQVRQVTQHADAAIVGSAIVQCLGTNRDDRGRAIQSAAGLVAQLMKGVDGADARAGGQARRVEGGSRRGCV